MSRNKVILGKKEFLSLRDDNPTELQVQIERSVTHGRGYLSLEECLSQVNREDQKVQVTLYDCIEQGFLPVNISAGPWFESSKLCVFAPPEYRPLLERVEKVREKKEFDYLVNRMTNPLYGLSSGL